MDNRKHDDETTQKREKARDDQHDETRKDDKHKNNQPSGKPSQAEGERETVEDNLHEKERQPDQG
jgi:hypothetical protein